MSNLIHINKKQFHKKEVEKIIKILMKFTEKYNQLFNCLALQMNYNPDLDPINDQKIINLWDDWSRKVTRLGGIPRQFWVAEFRSYQNFYYHWAYPEKNVLYLRQFKKNHIFEDRFKIENMNCSSKKYQSNKK